MRGRGRLNQKYFFQELPPDVKDLVWDELRQRAVSSSPRRKSKQADQDVELVLEEITDDLINRHNYCRTIPDWLTFAEKEGE
ncbi:MAG: hypothetical protein HY669_03445 [Chloroflexi bacterium]|nr:hypothetical protein [Chloroflexota bacterium]